MKHRLILLLIFVAGAVQAQTDLDQWLAISQASSGSSLHVKHQIAPFIHSLSDYHCSDLKMLRKTFKRVHRTFLKKYEAYSDFGMVFSAGQYDCLTATALFSYVLDQLQFSYDIIETNYHIFLIVKTTQGKVLIETTDRFGGFVIGEEAIAQRTRKYGQNELAAGHHDSKYYYHYSFSLCQRISNEKLIGLMYFNQAVKAYNQRDWIKSSAMLETANGLYASPRCEELGIILVKTIVNSSLDDKAKASCLAHLKNYQSGNIQPLASN